MSDAVFPNLPGIAWSLIKSPKFSTTIHTSASGRETRVALMSYPHYTMGLNYDVLRADATKELQQLMDFFLARKGAFDNFLYQDPDDCAVTNQQFGTGDGATARFPLVRAVYAGGFLEPVMNLNGAPSISKAGTLLTTGYTVSALGVVTFSSAPTVGQALTWTGGYYFRCRFVNDQMDFDEFMYQLWQLKKCDLIGSLGNKI
jgi:uncharacterized protein (TIGR02217 family)